jgi:hypothetical protein
MTPEEKADILEIDARLTEIAYRHAELAVQRATDHFARLDTKATTLAGIVGLITTVLLSVAANAFQQQRLSSWLVWASAVLFLFSLAMLFISIGYCISALRVRDIQDVPLIRDVLEGVRLLDRRPGDDVLLKKRLLIPLSRVDHGFAIAAQQKATRLQRATSWLAAAFVALALGGLLLTVNQSLKLYGRNRSSAARAASAERDTSVEGCAYHESE